MWIWIKATMKMRQPAKTQRESQWEKIREHTDVDQQLKLTKLAGIQILIFHIV